MQEAGSKKASHLFFIPSYSICGCPSRRRLGFANASDVIEVKGRVACEISR